MVSQFNNINSYTWGYYITPYKEEAVEFMEENKNFRKRNKIKDIKSGKCPTIRDEERLEVFQRTIIRRIIESINMTNEE